MIFIIRVGEWIDQEYYFAALRGIASYPIIDSQWPPLLRILDQPLNCATYEPEIRLLPLDNSKSLCIVTQCFPSSKAEGWSSQATLL